MRLTVRRKREWESPPSFLLRGLREVGHLRGGVDPIGISGEHIAVGYIVPEHHANADAVIAFRNHGLEVPRRIPPMGNRRSRNVCIAVICEHRDFGPMTKRSVTEFQRVFGINPTGIIGGVTWDTIAGVYSDLRFGFDKRPYQNQIGRAHV